MEIANSELRGQKGHINIGNPSTVQSESNTQPEN